jgi:hypothetical protein
VAAEGWVAAAVKAAGWEVATAEAVTGAGWEVATAEAVTGAVATEVTEVADLEEAMAAAMAAAAGVKGCPQTSESCEPSRVKCTCKDAPRRWRWRAG